MKPVLAIILMTIVELAFLLAMSVPERTTIPEAMKQEKVTGVQELPCGILTISLTYALSDDLTISPCTEEIRHLGGHIQTVIVHNHKAISCTR